MEHDLPEAYLFDISIDALEGGGGGTPARRQESGTQIWPTLKSCLLLHNTDSPPSHDKDARRERMKRTEGGGGWDVNER